MIVNETDWIRYAIAVLPEGARRTCFLGNLREKSATSNYRKLAPIIAANSAIKIYGAIVSIAEISTAILVGRKSNSSSSLKGHQALAALKWPH